MKHLILSLTAVLLLLSCQKETPKTEEILPKKETENPQTTTSEPEKNLFIGDDGSTLLNGTPAENFKNIILKMQPKYIGKEYEPKLTSAQIQEIKTLADGLAEKDNPQKTFQNIFTWVHKNIQYNQADNEPYSVFKNRKAVCQGYANLLKVMLATQQIPAMIVYGELKDPNARGNDTELGHAWNYVLVDGKWIVSDPTNNRNFSVDEFQKYRHLVPLYLNIEINEDENFVYTYREGNLTINQVKKSAEKLVVPFSTMGFQITAFNPMNKLPQNIKEIYLGKNIASLGKNLIGLKENAPNLEQIFVDKNNSSLEEYKGIIYEKGQKLPYFIPAKLQKIEFKGIAEIGKNIIINHSGVTEIIFSSETKKIGAYAVENCTNLKIVRVSRNTELDPQAIYLSGNSYKIERY